jgi:hypothetical protein
LVHIWQLRYCFRRPFDSFALLYCVFFPIWRVLYIDSLKPMWFSLFRCLMTWLYHG